MIIATFASNVSRLQQILDIAAKRRPQGRASAAEAWRRSRVSRPSSAT
ncbi:MAG: hypothetical protein ACLUNO_02965 [Oscillospiraceae bacterium]